MAYQNDKNGSLRAAGAEPKPASRLAAGPFEAAPGRDDNETTLPDALITGILVVYPVLATVVAVMVGLAHAAPVV